MGWIKDGIVDFLIEVYTNFLINVQDLFDLASVSPNDWKDGVIWNAVTNFNKQVILPVAWMILSLFLMLELASLFKRSDVKGNDAFYWVFRVILKILVAKIVMDNMDLIIGAIFQTGAFILQGGKDFIQNANEAQISGAEASALADALGKKNVLTLLGYWIVALILQIAQWIAFLLCKMVIQLRLIEIYTFTAFCSFPFATLPSEEYSTIGKSFIKRMVALALHAVFISIILFIYVVVIKQGFVISVENPLQAFLEVFGYTLLLVVALFQTGGWSKGIVGV